MPESCLACKRRGALQPDLADEVLKLWRIANLVERYQNVCSTGLGRGSGRPSRWRSNRRTSSESRRSPSITIAAGVTTTAAAAAKTTTATPA